MQTKPQITPSGSIPRDQNFEVLIAPKTVKDFSPSEWKAHVTAMYQRRVTSKNRTKPASPAPGITLSKTKKGAWSIRRAKTRTFAYILEDELKALAKDKSVPYAELWSLFKAKSWIIAKDRMTAEALYAKQKELPW